MVGGVVNKTLGKDNFDSLFQFINHPGCEITSISYKSLKGFVFKLHINNLEEKDTEFYGLNSTTNIFDIPVDTIIIKLAILNEDEDDKDLPDYEEKYNEKGVSGKEMESHEDFKNEAILQSQIYEKTLSKGQPICPALIDFAVFDATKMRFLDLLESKCNNNDESKQMILYIKSALDANDHCKLGMISMESAATYKTFYDVYDFIEDENTIEDTPLKKQKLCEEAVFQIIRLYNECRIVHCDLHGNNIMVKKIEGSDKYKIFVIDFGRVVKIDELKFSEKYKILQYGMKVFRTSFLNQVETPRGKGDSLRIHLDYIDTIKKNGVVEFDKNYVKTIIQFIISVDYMYNYENFEYEQESKIQNNYVDGIDRETSYKTIVNDLNNYYSSTITCDSTKYKTLHRDTSFTKKIAQYKSLCDKLKETKSIPIETRDVIKNTRKRVLSASKHSAKVAKMSSSKRMSISPAKSSSKKRRNRSSSRKKTFFDKDSP